MDSYTKPVCQCLVGCGIAILLAMGLGLWSAPVVAGPSEDVVLARVNNVQVTRPMLDSVVEEYRKKTGKKEVTEEEKDQLLNNLITRQLILQSKSAQILKNDEDIVKRVKKHEEDLIIEKFLRNQIGGQMPVSDEEIRKYYQENRHQFSGPPRVVARHILLRNREDAEKVVSKLKAGMEFGELAKQFSIDLPMALEGGPMGTIEKGKTLPELEKVLFAMGEGEVSDVVKTRYGYHILTVDRNIPAQPDPLDKVKEQIKETILRQKESKAYGEMTKKLKEGADVEIYVDLKKAGVK